MDSQPLHTWRRSHRLCLDVGRSGSHHELGLERAEGRADGGAGRHGQAPALREDQAGERAPGVGPPLRWACAGRRGDAGERDPFGVLASRFSKALAAVRSGSKIDAADCRGSGKATTGRHFSRFSCAVTSRALEIPSVELVYSEGAELPTVIEGSPRILGPWKGRLDVRVVGRSAMRYAQAQ